MAGNLNILSKDSRPFSNRQEAGKLLSKELKRFGRKNICILGIPRGGIVIAREVAKNLGIDYDIMLTRKISAPFNSEFAIGAVNEDGVVFLNDDFLGQISVKGEYIQEEKARQLREIKRRAEIYRKIKPKIPLNGKVVVLTDDGIATGATMFAALLALKQENPIRIIIALPVGPEENLRRLSKDVDELICLRAPDSFAAVGQFYADFPQIEDSQVIELLKESAGESKNE